MRRSGRRTPTLLAAATLVFGAAAHAQRARPPEQLPDEALRVFVDCQDVSCDEDFLRTEIAFATFVRDRGDAHVDVLVTSQPTSGHGTELTVRFIGQKEFQGVDDELRYVAAATASDDETRRGLARLLERGLIRYANHTALAERIQISYATPAESAAPAPPPRDRWNHWTFSTMLSGAANGEKATKLLSINASLSADRTTEQWKINSSIQGGYSESRFDAGDAGTFTAVQRNYALNALVVRSIGGHWAAGGRATLTSSTFLNQRRTLRLGPAVEYNVYPYTESTRRQLTVQYTIGVTALDYIEETIFGKTSERLMDERVLASLQLRQPWGSVGASFEGSHFLNDFGKRRGVGITNVAVRVLPGVSLVLFGGFELVRDQLFLPRRDASTSEILLQRRELATSFRYFSSIGISYTFGSPFAGVVNSRFAGSSAGTNILQ
ncbi:MAG TPA: hypothetical protein VF041_02305 [Gemmatimonadaceae bacterium]